MSGDRLSKELTTARAIELHDRLEADGFSLDEIVAIGMALAGSSLILMPPEKQLLHFQAHLVALKDQGFEIDHHGRAVVRQCPALRRN